MDEYDQRQGVRPGLNIAQSSVFRPVKITDLKMLNLVPVEKSLLLPVGFSELGKFKNENQKCDGQ